MSAMRSVLDGVPGLGPKRQAELRKHFGTVKAIREADETALAAVLPQNVPCTLWIRSMKRNPLKKTSCCPTGQRDVSAIGRIHPACRLFSQDFSRNTIVYLPVN